MRQNRFGPRSAPGSGGCSRYLLIGGGCLAVLIIGLIGAFVVGGLLWDRGSEAGANWASDWVSDRFGTDISERADLAEETIEDLPEPENFNGTDGYVEFLKSHNREFANAMDELGRLLSRPQLNDDQWSDDVAEQIAVIRQLESQAQQAAPPDGMEETHQHWLEGMGEFRRATDMTARAMDDFSPSGLGDAVDAMNNATHSYVAMAETLRDQGVLDDLEPIEDLETVDQP